VPPEHAEYYSEALILLPPTYQISFFDRHVSTITDTGRSHTDIEADDLISNKQNDIKYFKNGQADNLNWTKDNDIEDGKDNKGGDSNPSSSGDGTGTSKDGRIFTINKELSQKIELRR
jgi:hypothetical protein